MLTFVCWLWNPPGTGYKLPSAVRYTPWHVIALSNMLRRHYHAPYRLVCFTDQWDFDWRGLVAKTPGLCVASAPTKYAELGGCYRRLWFFSNDAEQMLGARRVSIDLDCVILKDITSLFDRDEPMIFNAYNPIKQDAAPDQFYNGSLMMCNPYASHWLWDSFDKNPEYALQRLEAARKQGVCIGTDQAYIRNELGKIAPRFTIDDGVYEARQCEQSLPGNARLVFFSGKRDPSTSNKPWVKENWK
jgi:hypothetical protein